MKSFITACVFAFVAIQYVAADKCLNQTQCPDANQCCAGIPPFGGNCLNLTPEGGKCHVLDRMSPMMFGEYIIGPCPCAEGLICVSTGGKKKNDGICTMAPTPAPVVSEEPASDDTPAEEPAADSSAGEEPASDSSAGEKPAGDDTPAEEPASDSSAGEEPAGDDTPAEEPAADSSAADSAAEA